MAIARREFSFKALTPIWTGECPLGDAKPTGLRTINSGLLGSIRWWFEVLVRGLGGYACDPTKADGRCPRPKKGGDRKVERCAVCELFGCTGWARKFRFGVLDATRQIQCKQIRRAETFVFRFTELRPIREEEWALLGLTLRLIANYGALGGKTVLKPSEEKDRAGKPHHVDYGLSRLISEIPITLNREALGNYLRWPVFRQAEQQEFWATLKNFWFLPDGYLTRKSHNSSSFNRVLGRDEMKPRSPRDAKPVPSGDKAGLWLAGGIGKSKKVFSFKDPERTFGFINPDVVNLEQMKNRLQLVGLKTEGLLAGEDLLAELFWERNR